jgi:hypothetical protein
METTATRERAISPWRYRKFVAICERNNPFALAPSYHECGDSAWECQQNNPEAFTRQDARAINNPDGRAPRNNPIGSFVA